MKKLFFALMMMAVSTTTANAMSYEQARNEALFLTDKMAYELNLSDEQYEAAYEINLDYLMGVTGRADVFGTYWERRNLDLSYILYDWQWNAFVAASYFYRPLYWEAGYWHFGIYLRYPHRDYFYFGRPHFYATYRGAHAWHHYGGHGYYHGHSNHYRGHHDNHVGMHDRWDRGDFRGPRNSSTRVTGGRHDDRHINGPRDNRNDRRNGNFDNRGNGQRDHRNNGSGNFDGRRDGQRSGSGIGRHSGSSSRQSVPQSRISNQNRVTDRGRVVDMSGSRNSGSHSHSGVSHNGGSRSGGSFSGGSRSHSSVSHSSGSSRSGGSFSSGSRGGGSFSGGSHSSHSSGSRGGGSHGGGSHGGGSHGHGGHR